MRVLIVGGKLQGVEAAYLAGKAGWEAYLVDKEQEVPASGICTNFYQMDVRDVEQFTELCAGVDLIIPALENMEILTHLQTMAKRLGIPLAFDSASYRLSQSKLLSDKLFQRLQIPAPSYWPQCKLPVIAKPAEASGSKGVQKLTNTAELSEFLHAVGEDVSNWVIQEYLEGPSYSLEVVGLNGEASALKVTELGMDQDYDCSLVSVPTAFPEQLERDFQAIGLRIAKVLKLTGIMDVEVIYHEGELKVLEIDARLPSQTPAAVYHASGINMLALLHDIFVKGVLPQPKAAAKGKEVIYEHIQVNSLGVQRLGEHIMTTGGPLYVQANFFGADEAITNYQPQRKAWVATLICTGSNQGEAEAKRQRVLAEIQATCFKVG